MTTLDVPSSPPLIVYPDSDGQPMAENTLQWQWIVTITGGLNAVFAKDADVFVAGDLFWYPVEGRPDVRMAPDAMVAFGRPKGHRGSYRQWEEGGIAPQVVFEVLSPGNRFGEMSRKFGFYEHHGVEEYYILNPGPLNLELSGFLRRQDRLVEVEAMNGFVSPRLGVRFAVGAAEVQILGPDGRPLRDYQGVIDERDAFARAAEQERQRAEQERQRADDALRELERLRKQLGS